MDEVLDNLEIGDVLYTTRRGTDYKFLGMTNHQGIRYSINQNQKTLPHETIAAAEEDFMNGRNINAHWYRAFNLHEYESRPCNLSVLMSLLYRIDN